MPEKMPETPNVPTPAGEPRWRRAEIIVVWGLAVLLLVALAWLWAQQRGWFGSGAGETFTPESRLKTPVEVNSASAADLQHVRGIGEKRARDIILMRDEMIHLQRVKKDKSVGWRNTDDFIESVRSIPGFSAEIENELRRNVTARPLSR